MRTIEDTMPDRSTLVYHDIRSEEKWHGFLALFNDSSKQALVKKELDGILAASSTSEIPLHEVQAEEIGGFPALFAKGQYSDELVEKLKIFLDSKKGLIKGKPEFSEGSYFYFVGLWLRDLKSKYLKQIYEQN